MNSRKDYRPKKDKTLIQNTYEALLLAFLLGAEHVLSDIELADIVDEPVSFEEAALFLQSRIPLTKEEYEKIDKRLQFKAFAVARLTQFDAVWRVKKLIEKALKEGKTVNQFIEETGMDKIIAKAGFDEANAWYWETVFRTNIQSAYNAGRAYQIEKTPVKYLEFIGITDARQTPVCRSRSGVIRPKNDPFWASNWPPLHYNCRSTVRAVADDEYKGFGLKTTPPSALKNIASVPVGFGANPITSGSFYKLTKNMVKRLKRYGIYDEIQKAREKLGIKDGVVF